MHDDRGVGAGRPSGVAAGAHPINFAVHQVRAGVQGAREDFQHMVSQLVRTTSPAARMLASNPGDWGIDVLCGRLDDRVIIWQAKYFIPCVSRSHHQQIRDSFASAVRHASNHGYRLTRWVLCVPSSMDGPTAKWWDRWKVLQQEATSVDLELWDETTLRELLISDVAESVRKHFYEPARSNTAAGDRVPDSPNAEYRLEPIARENRKSTEHYQRAPSYLLDSANEVVPYRDRPEEASLEQWLAQDWTTSICLVHGEGGKGKTRLARHFAMSASEAGWHAVEAIEGTGWSRSGVLASRIENDATQPLLMVVDYCERWSTTTLLSAVLNLVMQPRWPRVAILLLARDGWDVWKLVRAQTDRYVDFYDEPIALGDFVRTPVDSRRAFSESVQAFQNALAIPSKKLTYPKGNQRVLNRSPLVLQMAALAAVCADRDGVARPERQDLSTYLLHHERRFWIAACADGSSVSHAAAEMEKNEKLVYLATLFGPIEQRRDARQLLLQAHLADGAAEAESLISQHSRLYPRLSVRYFTDGGFIDELAGSSGCLSPLRPDRFAEDYIAECLSKGGYYEEVLFESVLRGNRAELSQLSRRRAYAFVAAGAWRHEHVKHTFHKLIDSSAGYMHTNSKGIGQRLLAGDIDSRTEDEGSFYFYDMMTPSKGYIPADLPETKEVKEDPRTGSLSVDDKK
jgi:hypothetical protein